jgi:hypothetical protein
MKYLAHVLEAGRRAAVRKLKAAATLATFMLAGAFCSNALASNWTTSVAVPGGGTLSFTESLQTVQNPTCKFDIPTYLVRSASLFSYSAATVVNPTEISKVTSVPGCSGDIVTTPAVLHLSNNCSLTVVVAYYDGSVSATQSCPNVTLYPKYMVLGVTYAPPGPSSSVTYTLSNALSTTVTDSSSYSTSTQLTTSLSGGGKIYGALNGQVDLSSSTTATQTATSSTSTTVSATNLTSYKLSGPPSPPVSVNTPINHDYDIVWVWLNPVAIYTYATNLVTFNGFAYDEADLAGMDIYPVQIGMLRGTIPMDPSLKAELDRGWAASSQWYPNGGSPALTAADYADIMAADPYTNASYSVSPSARTSPDQRFTLVGLTPSTGGTQLQSFIYAPGSLSETFSNTYVNSSSTTKGASSTHSQSYGVALSASLKYGDYSASLKVANTLTWTNMQSSSIANSNTTTQIASFTLGSPCASCAYTGPTVFEVYEDNVFGTFMFDPVR